jgi:3-deoxy-manno-octulosonate cytidylyltransferase (CMP-KDO synthetase)
MASQRFPGKPLVDLNGKPMVQWVYEAAQRAAVADDVVVASPDQEILDAARGFGARPVRTGVHHATGTDRTAEVASKIQAEFYINVQGDEPLVAPETIAACARILAEDSGAVLASLYAECPERELDDPSVVKVATDLAGWSLMFSRYPVPFPRAPRQEPVKKHIGIYGYRRDPLLEFARWPQTPLETAESLEQLRFLEHGLRFKMGRAEATPVAVDTPEQAEQVRRILARS